MNTGEFYGLQSGDDIVATAPGAAQGFTFDVGTIGRIFVSEPDDEKCYTIHLTKAVRLDFSYFSKEKWERLVRCGQCERSFPVSVLNPCGSCERSDYCAQCLETHNCVIPKMGISRRPRPQNLINRLHAKGEVVNVIKR